MTERAGLFDGSEDLDLSSFTPKKVVKPSEAPPAADAVRAVSEASNFRSREPVSITRKVQRRRRTGRNLQLNLKVAAETFKSFYEIADRQGWVLGETLERAVAALQRELATEK
jgi:hypothetical protein